MSEAPENYLVVGTAGHIDHGKTSLVRRLTGRDLDTLPEEKARGITIALGFTSLPLPGGRVAAFVDVPGHERLVRTMVAGATGVDAVLLCVSAVEGVMPQTREHLAILGLLGVDRGVVALTFSDLVDEELLMLAEEELRDLLQGTALAQAPIIPFSSVTGRGEAELVAALDRLPGVRHEVNGPFRLSVDRVFTQHGHGTVVTGTVRSGTLHEGDEVEVVPGAIKARVRGIQVHGEPAPSTRAGLRTALNINIAHDELSRGAEIATPGMVPGARFVDVAYRHLPGAPVITEGAQVRFLVGTAEVVASARPIGTDQVPPEDHSEGLPWSGFLQLRLAEAAPCRPGDRYVLRRASPMVTLGGGRVLDPWSRPLRHRDRQEALTLLERLGAGQTDVLLLRAGMEGLVEKEARVRGVGPGSLPQALKLGDRILHVSHVQVLEAALRDELARYHAATPLSPGALRKELAHGVVKRVDDRVLEALLDAMTHRGDLALASGRYRLATFDVRFSIAQKTAMEAISRVAAEAGLAALSPAELGVASGFGEGEKLAHLLVDQGVLIKVGPFLADRAAADRLVVDVKAWLLEQPAFTPADARNRTGLTRKHLIPWLEWLDGLRVTRRVGDQRVAGGR